MRLPKPWPRKINGKTYWYVEWCGKQIRLGTDKKKAFAKYNELLRENVIGPGAARFAKKDETTFHDLIDAYATELKQNRAPSSWLAKQYYFRDLKAAFPDTLAAVDFRPYMLDDFINAQPKIKSPTTKRDRITTLVGAYNWAVAAGRLSENPLSGMRRPRARVRQDFVPAERFAELIGAIKSSQLKEYVTVSLESGARAQEMLRVSAYEFDGEKFVFWIEDSKGEKRSRVIFLPPRSLAIVKRLAAENPSGPLFRNRRGQPWTKDSINCHMRRLKVVLDMPWLCATTLRHSFAYYRLTNEQDGLTVSKLMGHVDTKMLATRYGHLDGSKFLRDKANELPMPLGGDS